MERQGYHSRDLTLQLMEVRVRAERLAFSAAGNLTFMLSVVDSGQVGRKTLFPLLKELFCQY